MVRDGSGRVRDSLMSLMNWICCFRKKKKRPSVFANSRNVGNLFSSNKKTGHKHQENGPIVK